MGHISVSDSFYGTYFCLQAKLAMPLFFWGMSAPETHVAKSSIGESLLGETGKRQTHSYTTNKNARIKPHLSSIDFSNASMDRQ